MKYFFTLFFTSLFIFYTYAQSCNGRYENPIYNNIDVTTVAYGEAINMAGDTQVLEMDIYQAIGDTATDRPVVIFCFGGSFYTGSRTSAELVSFANSFAQRGYVAASIDYRLASSVIDLASEETMVKVVFGAVQDGKAAIRYFRKNFDEGNSLGIDPDQIFIGGTSAGGILAINLAYVDSTHKLPQTWQTWANEIGGLEGNSGNSGYCSYVSGVFGFAGAVGDTSYINANDVPFYGIHAEDDQTVPYNYAKPLNGLAPVYLYGSNLIHTRLNNLGIYSSFDSYTGSEHPPFSGNMTTTTLNLSTFIYNLLDCNSNNRKKANQQNCNDFYIEEIDTTTTGVQHLAQDIKWSIYPNPTQHILNVRSQESFNAYKIYDLYGKLILEESIISQNNYQIELPSLARGVYLIQLQKDNILSIKNFMIH